MKVKQAMIDYNVRLTYEDKWLVFDGNEWVVYYRAKYAKHTNVLYRGFDEDEAVRNLLKD